MTTNHQEQFAGDFARGLLIFRGTDGRYVVIRDDAGGPRFERTFKDYNALENFQRAFFAPQKQERKAA